MGSIVTIWSPNLGAFYYGFCIKNVEFQT
jgi:hypothetical protein